jgi:hypothetical protein
MYILQEEIKQIQEIPQLSSNIYSSIDSGDAAISGGYEVLVLNNPPNVITLRDGLIRTDPTSLTDSYRTTLLGPSLTFNTFVLCFDNSP